MSGFEKRIERLEKQTGVKPGPRLIYITPNLEDDDSEETPYSIKLSPGVWAEICGAPLSEEEIRSLKENSNV
jgi:hypothetical protein